MAIGATIDFESGIVPRAPRWVSSLGLEWLFRLAIDPKRLWKRYILHDPSFLWLVLQQKINRYHYQEPIGVVLQKSGLLSRKQVRSVIQVQKERPYLLFGEIVVQQGWLEQDTIDFVLEGMSDKKERNSKRKTTLAKYLEAAKL